MFRDPIVEEVRKHRQEIAAKFNYDLKAIFEYMRKREPKGGRFIAPRSKRSAKRTHSTQASAEDLWRDPIVDKVHRHRREIAAEFNNDLDAIFEDARKREATCGHPIAPLPKKLARGKKGSPPKSSGK